MRRAVGHRRQGLCPRDRSGAEQPRGVCAAGVALTLLGHPDQAILPAKKAVDLNPNAHNLSMLAMAQDWNDQVDEAIKTALRAVDKDPLSAEAHAVLAEVYADKNNWIRALEEARTAVNLKPDSALVQRNLGYVLERQGRHEEAIQAYDCAAKLAPKLGFSYIGAGNTYPRAATTTARSPSFRKLSRRTRTARWATTRWATAAPLGRSGSGHLDAAEGDRNRSDLRPGVRAPGARVLLPPELGISHR